MPQTNEVLEFAKSMGFSNKSIDDQTKENDTIASTENLPHQTTDEHNEQSPINTNDSTQTVVVVAGNRSVPSSSPSSTSSVSAISSSGK
jgi:hypothetical protein